MNIGQAAKATGLAVKTIRYYADIGLVAPQSRSETGYRQFSAIEITKLIFVRRARAFGFSVEQTRELLSLYEDRHRSSGDVKRIAARRLADIEARMGELQSLRDELAHLVDACHGDQRPDCPILSGLGGGPEGDRGALPAPSKRSAPAEAGAGIPAEGIGATSRGDTPGWE